MSDLKTALNDAVKDAMKAKDNHTRDVLRELTAAVKQVEIDTQKPVDDDGVMDTILKEIKKLRDTIEESRGVGREDLATEAEGKLVVMQRFLPEQLTRDELQAIVQEVIAETGVTDPKQMGKVMGALMPRVKGRADGKLVNEVVRDALKD
ncbi:MAG: GatB/YqeY domain-containing protein [Phototrophicaceae bacterium]|jgi:uncharacterized protein YqeY